MFRPLTYTIGSLLAMSLTTSPLYAEKSSPINQESSYILLAHNDDKEKKEEKGKKGKDRGKHLGEKKKSGKETEKPAENKAGTEPTAPAPAGNISGNMTPPAGANVSGAQTPPPSGAETHVSGGK